MAIHDVRPPCGPSCRQQAAGSRRVWETENSAHGRRRLHSPGAAPRASRGPGCLGGPRRQQEQESSSLTQHRNVLPTLHFILF